MNGETQKPDREGRRKKRATRTAKNADTFKKLRVMVLCHEDLVPPESIEGLSAKEIAPFKTEWDVISTMKKMGHEVYPVGVYNNLGVAQARRGKKSAVENFQRAAEADSHDADYRFNLALALYRAGNTSEAARQARDPIRPVFHSCSTRSHSSLA